MHVAKSVNSQVSITDVVTVEKLPKCSWNYCKVCRRKRRNV